MNTKPKSGSQGVMTMLDLWVQTPLAQALGAALLHSVWQAGVAAATLAGLLYLVRPASSRLRHDAACVLLLAVPVAFAATLAVCYPKTLGGAADIATLGASGAAMAEAAAVSTPAQSLMERLAAVSPWLAAWWMAGVLLLNLQYLVGWIGVRRLQTEGTTAAGDDWQRRLPELAGKIGVSAPVRLFESSRVDSPAVLGLLKPVILVPMGMLTASPAAHVELILLHELAHVRRQDYAVNLLRRVVESLFFYHPAVWWMSSVVAEEREHCCDDLVVEVSGAPREYAAALFGLETLRAVPEPALGAAGGSLLRRVRRLVGQGDASARPTPVAAVAGVALVLGLALFGWQAPMTAAPQALDEMAAHEKWLAYDVVHIIQQREKEAFLELSTEAERDRFVEQFWERRDPTPGTPANEFKEEHYRRIEYANQRFGTDPLAAWSTDTARIYVLHGPPDEMEVHPSGGGPLGAEFGAETPYQMWRYRTDGFHTVYIFVDRNQDGNYELNQRSEN